jgi:hypothetical protein
VKAFGPFRTLRRRPAPMAGAIWTLWNQNERDLRNAPFFKTAPFNHSATPSAISWAISSRWKLRVPGPKLFLLVLVWLNLLLLLHGRQRSLGRGGHAAVRVLVC